MFALEHLPKIFFYNVKEFMVGEPRAFGSKPVFED